MRMGYKNRRHSHLEQVETMKVFELVNLFAILGIATTAKTSGPFWVYLHFAEEAIEISEVCKTHFWTERKPKENRIEGYEKLISGFLNCTKSIGPLSAQILVYKWTETGWKTSYTPIQVHSLCSPPYGELFSPFFKKFEGKLNMLTCTISAGNYQMQDWSVEPSLRMFSDTLPFRKYKTIMTWYMPGIKNPITGMILIFETKYKEFMEHVAKTKNNN